jgi:pilus assembly protein FimV
MAFGFGFNKQKVLASAEKFVQQGKLQNAISEYEKVLKADPKDLTVMNTVGDLHARLGENDKAAECFKNVGDAYAGQGFTVKAIAMYKKLSKLKASTECVLRLAELYTQQGLFNDARAQYLQVAEDFLKSGQIDQAIRIFQKTLEMDPDNVPMRTRLAEAYVRMGKKDEAWQLLTAAAESLRAKGQLAAADEILQRMLTIDPQNSYVLVLRGRASVDAGDFAAAIECLSKVADLDNNVDGLRALFHAYLRSRRFEDASTLVTKLVNVHDDVSAVFEYGAALVEAQQYRGAVQVYDQFADRLLRADSGKLLEALRLVVRHVQDDTQALEMVLAIFQKGGENAQLTEIYELLAHGYVQSGELEKAREYYLKLMQLEPANQMHARNYQQVLEKLGSPVGPRPITPEEGAVMVDELEASAPSIEQRYDDDVALAVRAALTDAELFISYNMPAKALDPLLSALPKAPRDLRLNQKLAALHTRAGRLAEAAVCCRTLESIYHDAGHADEASRYGDLAAKYEERNGTPAVAAAGETAPVASAEVGAVQEFQIAVPTAEHLSLAEMAPVEPPVPTEHPVASPSGLFFHGASSPPDTETSPALQSAEEFTIAAAPEQTVEIDIGGDWEQDFSIETPKSAEQPDIASLHSNEENTTPEVEQVPVPVHPEAPPVVAPNLDEAVEEVRFYLGQGMTEQAEQVLARVEALAPGSPELAVLHLGIDSAKQLVPPSELEPTVSVEEPAPAETAASSLKEEAPVAHTIAQPQPWPSERPVLKDIVSELEASLGDGFGVDAGPAVTPQPAKAGVGTEASNKFTPGTLDEFVADLEASLGNDFGTETPATVAHPQPPAPIEAPVARAAAAAINSTRAAEPPSIPASQPSVLPAPQKFDSAANIDLSDMFGELKQELEHDAASTEEDPETHYNLGVAFREMGLLDEAIGELQKVCQFVDRGHPFTQILQAYTWLAQCFIEKGLPEVAVRWYEKALKIPSLDQDTRTALHYELASSLESAGNNPAALSNFLEVYSSNIDYRDVAERIKALRT